MSYSLGLNIDFIRAARLRTFAITTVSSFGASLLNPRAPFTTVLTYGLFSSDDGLDVRIISIIASSTVLVARGADAAGRNSEWAHRGGRLRGLGANQRNLLNSHVYRPRYSDSMNFPLGIILELVLEGRLPNPTPQDVVLCHATRTMISRRGEYQDMCTMYRGSWL